MLFRPDELAEVIASPSADSEGDVERAALVGITPPFEDQRFVLKRGKTLIGRREDNDIILPDDSVSSQHAWILHEDGSYRVINMLSTNGTFVNDERIHDHTLSEGDRIRLGRAEFVFHGGLPPVRPKAVQTGVPGWVWGAAALVLALAAAALLAF
ncbi:FHA domain-containing protein [Pseudothauera rhizosphaerae]|uniref:FHA domain-containing protein n=1 Tax=Pseudothauera rhizosphaerae TaxID=2565932 RepID=A0A4S4AQC9_9RHOO|nr:FHA domain-containing protein [Pseudothauera rhizosphaerae]